MIQFRRTLAGALLCLTALYSCKKEQNSPVAANGAGMKKLSATADGSVAFPSVENGMLVFKDDAHFDSYIAYLDKAVDPGSYNSAPVKPEDFDQDAILEAIETNIGFTSIRKLSHDKFMELSETGWDKLEQVPAEHFIGDAVMRSVLNKDLNVKIGSYYVHYISKDLGVQVDAAHADLLQVFGKLTETATLDDVLAIDPSHQYSAVWYVSGAGIVSNFGKLGRKPLAVGDLSIINFGYSAPYCDNPRRIVFSKMQLHQEMDPLSQLTGSLEGTFVVDFGDGSPLQTFHSYLPYATGYAVVPDFEHVYPAAGSYTLKVDATANAWYYGANGTTAYLQREILVANTSCKNDVNKETEDEYHYVPDGSRAWSGKITVGIKKPWGDKQTRILAETSSWLWNGNKWKPSKAEIWHSLHSDRRDNGCNILGPVDGDGWAGSAAHISTHRTDDPYYWNRTDTKHGIKYHGEWYFFDKSVSVCP